MGVIHKTLFALSLLVFVAVAIHIPDSLVITVKKVSLKGVPSNLLSISMTMPDRSTLTLSMTGTFADGAPGFHYTVDAALHGSRLLGDVSGSGRMTIVSEKPLVMTGSFSLKGHSIVLGHSSSSPTGIVLSYNAHHQVIKHTDTRFGPGAERAALSTTFADIGERQALRNVKHPREAFKSEYCGTPAVAHEISVSVFVDRGFAAALANDLGIKVSDSSSETGLTKEAEAWIHSLVSQASLPFEESFRTRVRLANATTLAVADRDKLSLHKSGLWDEVPKTHSNRGCAYDIDTKLTQFSAWWSNRDAEQVGVSSAILLTDCYPPQGTIGLANTGYVCDTQAAYCERSTKYGYEHCHKKDCPEKSAACFANTAVVSYVSGQAPIVFGHELAHLTGCVHSSTRGDIMSTYLSAHVNPHFNHDDAERACTLLEVNEERETSCVRKVNN
jgi:hypothetical protein